MAKGLELNTMRLTHPFCNAVLEGLVSIGIEVTGNCNYMAIAQYEGKTEGFGKYAVIFPATLGETTVPHLTINQTTQHSKVCEVLTDLTSDEGGGGYYIKIFSPTLERDTLIRILDGTQPERILGWRRNPGTGLGETVKGCGVKGLLLNQNRTHGEMQFKDSETRRLARIPVEFPCTEERIVYPPQLGNLLIPNWKKLNERYQGKHLPFDEDELVEYNPDTMTILGVDKNGVVIIEEKTIEEPPAPAPIQTPTQTAIGTSQKAPAPEKPLTLTGRPQYQKPNRRRR